MGMDRYEWRAKGHTYWALASGDRERIIDGTPGRAPVIIAAVDEILRLAERLREAEDLLREIEYTAGVEEDCCPSCLCAAPFSWLDGNDIAHHVPGGHAADCRLAKFLVGDRPASVEG